MKTNLKLSERRILLANHLNKIIQNELTNHKHYDVGIETVIEYESVGALFSSNKSLRSFLRVLKNAGRLNLIPQVSYTKGKTIRWVFKPK